MTVRGRVPAADLGMTLVHEHVLVDFVGADTVSPDRYDRDDAYRKALPHLRQAYGLGVRTLVECTPAYLGRDPQLLVRLSQATDLHIVTNTGYYGAADDRFVPAHAYDESTRALADRWIAEWRDGIDGTEVRPGFMKIGVDSGPLSAIDRKLVEAAAITHAATGLAIASHTGDGVAAHEELDVLASRGIPLQAFIWVHAQSEKDVDVIRRAAQRGAWISLDGISASSADRHVELVLALADGGLLRQVLVSHDAGWYRVGEPDGGEYRPHDAIFTHVLPRLRERLGDAGVTQLLVDNPARALAIDSGRAR
jgi:phosphotriesterase-related protein